MQKLKICLFKVFLFILLAQSEGYGQISSKDVDLLVADAMEKFGVAGVAVGIVKDGKIIHSKGYGVKSVDTKEKVNRHTPFAISSNSKAFTTTALAILADEGKMAWEDKVVNYIPEFKMYNSYVTENFTIQDLLTHRSGLGPGAGDLMFIPAGTDFTIKDILTSFSYFEPQSDFRTTFNYDNLLYIVAGELIARVSGMSWEDFIQKRIIKPLAMENTYSSLSEIKDRSNLATPHLSATGALKTISPFEQTGKGAAGGIYSGVNDLCRWMLVHLNKGTYGKGSEKRLFAEDRQREMWKIYNSLEVYPDERYNTHFKGYGLGWFLEDMRGNMLVSHTGGLPGVASELYLVPDMELGIVVLINTADKNGYSPTEPIALSILDSYLGLEDNQWVTIAHEATRFQNNEADSIVNAVWEIAENANHKNISPLNYTGIYEDDWFGKVEVFMKENELWFRSYRSPRLNGKMSWYKAFFLHELPA